MRRRRARSIGQLSPALLARVTSRLGYLDQVRLIIIIRGWAAGTTGLRPAFGSVGADVRGWVAKHLRDAVAGLNQNQPKSLDDARPAPLGWPAIGGRREHLRQAGGTVNGEMRAAQAGI